MTHPVLTFVVTSSNSSDELGATLRSLQATRFRRLECVVVDDASTDDSALVGQAFVAHDMRFRLMVHDRPLGLWAAQDTGRSVARAPMVTFLDVGHAHPRNESGEADARGSLPVRTMQAPPTVLPDGLVRGRGAVLLVPEARYHVDEVGPLLVALRSRGVPAQIMVSPNTVPTAIAELGRWVDEVLPFTPEVASEAAAIVTLNDWGPLRRVIEAANAAGVPTFAKVEGVQDFLDDDTGRIRTPYRQARWILGQGPNDVASLPDKEVLVVGSSRLELVATLPPVHPGDHVLANLNFTFGVLTDQRDGWLRSIADAARTLGVDVVVSRHPAEKGDTMGMEVAARPFRHEITKAGVLVSRFSTVPFEAMARGVPFVYHNPHREKVPTFENPEGAFWVSRSTDELELRLQEALDAREGYRERSWPFFAAQVDIDPGRDPAERAADAIVERLG
ncbi:MAG: glycosyltransferase [Propionicimonas sp.]